MAKLARKGQKIFARQATNNGVFGSLQAGNKQTSQDVETLQSLTAYSEGWNYATLSAESRPPLEEFQSLNYINTYQLAYMFQEGIPEWDSNSYYHQGSIVKVTTDNTFVLYNSLIDNNTGNNPATDRTNWAVYLTSDALSQGLPGWRNDVNYVKGAWVKGGDTETVIYESLVDNNLNHALTDISYWQIKSFGSIDNRVTNCILSAPKIINYTFTASNGLLTIKAGTKVYIPNGANTYDEYTFPSDLTINQTSTDGVKRYLYYEKNSNSLRIYRQNVSAEAGMPSGHCIYYDPSINQVSLYIDGVKQTNMQFSLPLLAVTSDFTNIVGFISEEYQFYSHIGEYMFLYPGTQVAIPDGRKADNTLNNLILTLSTVQTLGGYLSDLTTKKLWVLYDTGTLARIDADTFYEQENAPAITQYMPFWLNTNTNKTYVYQENKWVEKRFAVVAEAVGTNSGVITTGNAKPPIRFIDYFNYPDPPTGFMSYPTTSTTAYMYTGTQALPAGGTWIYWVHGNNHMGATDTSVLTGGIAAGGTVLNTNPGTGYEKSYFAWRIQ